MNLLQTDHNPPVVVPQFKDNAIVSGKKHLKRSVYTLFFIGLCGQFLFAAYIFMHYGGTAIVGNWEAWSKSMLNGIIEGDTLGNIAILMHIVLAFVITVCGPLQFVPYFRSKAKTFHKWNGRIYISTALLISVGALYMVWVRPTIIGGKIGAVATSLNALLIIWFSIRTWRTAMERKFDIHRKWAIRTFIVISGVWFFRIGFGTWFLVTGFSAPGVSEELTGWFDRCLQFGSYLIPLAIAELYIRTKSSNKPRRMKWMAAFLYMLCPLLIGGTIVTAKIFWFG